MKQKKIETSYRIIKILKLLFEKPRTLHELYYLLDLEGWDIKRGTLTKYFTTLRKFGCVIEKKENLYSLKYFPNFMQLNKDDIEILKDLEKFAKDILSIKQYEKIKSVTGKVVEKTFDDSKDDIKYPFKLGLWGKYKRKIEILSNFMQENKEKIKILYEDKNYTITPENFRYKRDKIYLLAFDEEKMENKIFLLDKIDEILNLTQKSFKLNFAKSTIFKLTGRIANGYTSPYEKEIITKEGDSIIVENKYEDKNILMRRLLKYGDMCEILAPRADREKFKEMVCNLYEKYGRM